MIHWSLPWACRRV